MKRSLILIATLAIVLGAQSREDERPQQAGPSWSFAVSGDSRNCGDIVMPAIAAHALRQGPKFYWHLGDFRALYNFDEDIQHQPENQSKPLSISRYFNQAWPDFIENQVEVFGSVPVFLGIGNHELVPPKTREQYIAQFADWLDSPVLRQQRLQDNPRDHVLKSYYHWVEQGLDFITLDNASYDQFDPAQIAWLQAVLARDSANAAIKTIVVGMHRALPDSISAGHSMNESPTGMESGRRVYQDLLNAQNNAHKKVYVLASHSHFFMDGIFNTDYWRNHGGILPGWIVGTAGAVRYPLPPDFKQAQAAETNVYGYLLASVQADGTIRFAFQKLNETDVPTSTANRYKEFVHWCFAENTEVH